MAAEDLLLGAHVSIAGGIDRAIIRGEEIGCTAIQVFTANASRWQTKPLEEKAVERFRLAYLDSCINYVAAHDSYLINLASPDKQQRRRSIERFLEELRRCQQLGIGALVMHPGAHMERGLKTGLTTLVESFRTIFAEAPDDVCVLLENTAGQGTSLGASFAELAEILSRVPQGLFGVCFDTCHAFAAGYDLSTYSGYEQVMNEFEREIGCEKLCLFHLNDSKKPLGSRVDRHEHVGRGLIGEAGFRALMRDRRFAGVPRIIETPGGEQHCEDKRNLALLRRMTKP
jgi:deoxyribonuclease-4